MFDFCAIIGYDIDKKPNIDLILKNEYTPEILQIYPHHLRKSSLITQSIPQCFPNGQPYIYTAENKLFHPNHGSRNENGVQSKIHQFQVKLDDQTLKYCYVLSFYECAYIQSMETLAGNRVKVITWAPQLEIQTLINSKQVTTLKSALFQSNTNMKIYVQKAIVIVCNQDETGFDNSLVSFVNKQMLQSRSNYDNTQINIPENLVNLNQNLIIHKEQLLKCNRIPQFELESVIEYLNQTHKPQLVISLQDFEEGCKINQIPGMKFMFNEQLMDAPKITQDLYHLHDLKINLFFNPPDKVKQFRERVRKSNKKAKKPLVPIQAKVLISKPIEAQKITQNVRTQEFSFHESSDKKHSRIFSGLNFPEQKKLLKL